MKPDFRHLTFPGEEPFHALAEVFCHPEEHLGTDLAISLFITRELPLAHAQGFGQLLLVGVEAAQLAQPSADHLPIESKGFLFSHGWFLTTLHVP